MWVFRSLAFSFPQAKTLKFSSAAAKYLNKNKSTYLGFDLSTQKLKAVLLSTKLKEVITAEVKFDSDLPEFGTKGGANFGPKNNEVFVQPLMWIKAFDMVMDHLVKKGCDFSTIAAVGGAGQQHGSLYWSLQGIDTLKNLDSEKSLHVQLNESAFTMNRAPIWMDSSTEKQCLEMDAAVGGPAEMVNITGSKCYHRFTGAQIRKVYQECPQAYEQTRRISLVSSFLASIFLCDIAPIDYGDASGMNLFDIKAKCWSKKCLDACAPDLENRLCEAVSSLTIIGNVGDYFVRRYCFPAECKITAFTGDNPSALSGLVPDPDCLVISLGTSDTLISSLKEQLHLLEGHVLCHPTEIDHFMSLLCFRNGSLVRDDFNKKEANNDWKKFEELLNSTPCGNEGNMALHFPSDEIIPKTKGVLRWARDSSTAIQKFPSPQIEIRALIEGQMLHKRAVAEDLGFRFGNDTKIIATGGASSNKSILQVISDVFNAKVFVQKGSEAALLGSAFRAKYAYYLNSLKESNSTKPLSYRDYILQYIPDHLQLVCEPKKNCHQVYLPMLDRYRKMAEALPKA